MSEIINFKTIESSEKTNSLIKDKSNLAKNAEAYIKYETGQEVKRPEITVSKDGRINVDKRRSIRIDHKGVASDIVKIANMVPGLSTMSRKVLSIRCINPGITTLGISLATGINEMNVKMYEREGLDKIKYYLRNNLSYNDSVEKASKDNVVSKAIVGELNKQGNKNSLLKW